MVSPGVAGDDTSSMGSKISPSFSGLSETMLLTLGCRAVDAASPKPLLGDQWAQHVLDQVDYQLPKSPALVVTTALRGRLYDTWTVEFLNNNPEATVLHLGCGLDSRVLRLSWGPRVTWIDLDVPEVIHLRKTLLPSAPGDYRLIESSIMEDAWLEEIPADRPTLIIMEGLVSYLQPPDVENIVSRLCSHFSSGQIMANVLGHVAVRIQAIHTPIHNTGARFHFAMDDLHDFEKFHPRVKLKSFYRVWQIPGLELGPWYLRLLCWLMSILPGFRTYISYVLYDW
jgi:O-methyltransferase involved in polyketide biosynthesis